MAMSGATAPIVPDHRKEKPAMNESSPEIPTRGDSPNAKACWTIRKALREHPDGMTTRELINKVRKEWRGDRDFAGEMGRERIIDACITLSRGGAIEKVANA